MAPSRRPLALVRPTSRSTAFAPTASARLTPLATAMTIPAIAGFAYARTAAPSGCGSLTCCLSHLGVASHVFVVVGWALSLFVECFALLGYTGAFDRPCREGLLSAWPSPLLVLSVFSSVPETQNGASVESYCESAWCILHVVSTSAWVLAEICLVALRRPRAGWPAYVVLALVLTPLSVINLVRMIVPGLSEQRTDASLWFGTLELIAVAMIRTIAADSLQRRRVVGDCLAIDAIDAADAAEAAR